MWNGTHPNSELSTQNDGYVKFPTQNPANGKWILLFYHENANITMIAFYNTEKWY